MIADERFTYPAGDRRDIWQGHIFGISSEQVDLPAGRVLREFITHPGAVAIVALDDDDNVALIRQYRHPVRAKLWEIPAGLLDVAGEDYLTAARRELREETDLAGTEWHVLVDLFTSPGGSQESVRIFLARNLSRLPQPFAREDEEADMEQRFVPLTDAVAAVLAGRVHSPTAVAGLLAAHAARMNGWADLRPPDAPWLRSATDLPA